MYFLMHICSHAPLPVNITHPLCHKHSCTTRWQSSFQLKSVQAPQPFSYPGRTSLVHLSLSHLPFPRSGLPCPVPPEASLVVLAAQQALQPKGQARECTGSEMASQDKDFPGFPETVSLRLIGSLFLTFYHLFPWTEVVVSCSNPQSVVKWGLTHQSLKLSSLPNTSVLIHMRGKIK